MIACDLELAARMALLRQLEGISAASYLHQLFEEGVTLIGWMDGNTTFSFPEDFSGWWIGTMEILGPQDAERREYTCRRHDLSGEPGEYRVVPVELLRNAYALGLCLNADGMPKDALQDIPLRSIRKANSGLSEFQRLEIAKIIQR